MLKKLLCGDAEEATGIEILWRSRRARFLSTACV